MLPPLVRGEHKACFAVTEPDAGLDTTRIRTAARRTNAGYVIDGQKIWTTTAQHASHIMVLARTTPYEECGKKTQGLSLFYTAFDRDRIEAREIPKMGRSAVDSNQLFIDGLEVSDEDRIGEEGEGFRYLAGQPQPGAHPDRDRSGRHGAECHCAGGQICRRARRCLAGRSARTSRSSTRWPKAGWSSRRPN
jgi:hypothetical protein